MKILIDTTVANRYSSGIPVYVKELCSGLHGLSKNDEFYYLNNFKITDIPVFKPVQKINLLSKFLNFITDNFIRTFFIPVGFDIYHSPNFFLPYFLGVLKNTKKIITVHDFAFYKLPSHYSFKSKLFYKFMLRHSLRHADVIICISESTHSDLLYYYPEYWHKSKVIYNSYENYLNYIDSSLEDTHRNLFGENFLLIVGCSDSRKNVQTFINLFSKLSERYSGLELIITGDNSGVPSDLLNRQNIKFVGFVSKSELAYLYKNCKLLVHLSLYEGFGRPLLEAFSCGAIVAASNNSCFQEVTNYPAEYLINPNNSEEIILKISFILDNYELTKNILLRMAVISLNNFTIERMINSTYLVYQNFDEK